MEQEFEIKSGEQATDIFHDVRKQWKEFITKRIVSDMKKTKKTKRTKWDLSEFSLSASIILFQFENTFEGYSQLISSFFFPSNVLLKC